MEVGRVLSVWTLVIPLIIASLLAVPVIAPTSETASTTASVTVNKFVDITLTVNATNAGISFGSLDPGTSDNPDQDQTSTTPAATVTRETTSNTNIEIRSRGTNFSDGTNSFAVGNLVYDADSNVAGSTQTTTTFPGGAFATLTSASPTLALWFWLSIPSGQAQGSYSNTIDIQGS